MCEKDYKTEPGLSELYAEAMASELSPEEESEAFNKLATENARFHNMKLFAEGGVKQIYSCFDKHLQKEVAFAKYKKAEDDRDVDAFIHEAYMTSSLEHPNIVPVYDVGVYNNQPFFTMKLLKGRTLREIIEESTLEDRDKLLEIYLKVCDAISYAHSKGIVHLDLKPLNIKVDQFGDVLVYDWGIARELAKHVKTENRIEGSPGFMAPEQITQKIGDVAETSDVYSLGVILYNIITLEQAFSGETETVVKNQLNNQFKLPSQVQNLSVQNGIESVVLKAMQLEPEKRYQSVEKLAADVRAFIGGYATNAENASYSTLLKLLVKRNFRLFLAAAAVFILVIGLTAFFMKSLSEKRLEAETALKNLQKSEQARSKVSRKSANYILLFAERAYGNGEYKKSEKYVKNALQLNPNDRGVRSFELRFLFGQMKFAECLKKASAYNEPEYDQFKEACLAALKLQKKNELLSAEQLCDIIDERPKRGNLEWHMVHTVCYNYPLQVRIAFARERIKRRTVRNFNFDLSRDGEELKLSLKGSKGFSYINCLENLPLTSLDLSATGVVDLKPLKGMPLKSLNVSGTIVGQLTAVHRAPLEYLNVSGTQIKKLSGIKTDFLRELIINDHCENLTFLQKCLKLKMLKFPKRKYVAEDFQSLNLQAKVKPY